MTSFGVGLSREQKDEAAEIASELVRIAKTGEVLPGSIVSRRTHCGHPGCRCMADPPQLHGPYYQWTRKVASKTVGRWLSPDQATDYQVFIDNHRRLRELFARLETIGLETLETDPRTRRQR